MDRKALFKIMNESGELNRFQKTANWEAAFSLYKQETKDFKVDIGCSSCHRKVKDWLSK